MDPVTIVPLPDSLVSLDPVLPTVRPSAIVSPVVVLAPAVDPPSPVPAPVVNPSTTSFTAQEVREFMEGVRDFYVVNRIMFF